ncbi:hybrid sensor histidine kinase/response regulator [Aliidongia dinghuensis]|uniref:histidine kinase n=1 Tax=Aliidongia dinghuensis TaxID=1867774 RepID=A0A8J2YYM2_9PROT|nr:PAS domain-containing protein [Aliidongia dinghuensis]GGF37111.1 hybrid sensor histidine kinase/response regulator [Aliidongia dinghuensis]
MVLEADRAEEGGRRLPTRGVKPLLVSGLVASATSLALGAWLGTQLPAGSIAFDATLAIDLVAMLAFVTLAVLGARLAAAGRMASLARQALEALPDAAFVTDPQGVIGFANAAYVARFSGGRSPLQAFLDGAEDEEEVERELNRLRTQARVGGTAHAELRARFLDGRVGWFEVTVAPIASVRGGAVWQLVDITDKRQLRGVIEAGRTMLFEFFDGVPFGLYSIDETGRFLMINETLAGWLGASPEQLINERARIEDFLVASDDATRVPFDPQAPGEGREVILAGRQGRLTYAAISQTIEGSGPSRRTCSVVRDLAPDRAREEALVRARQRFQRFFEIAPVGIALIDTHARFKETNPALERLLLTEEQQLAGRNLMEFVIEDDQVPAGERLAQIVKGTALDRPLELRVRTGRGNKTLALFASRLDTTEGSIAGLILHFIDLTEQKNLELQFAQSQKMQAVGQLAGGVAHDFNNLLTAMIGFCDLLLLRFRPGDQSFADIMQIKQNANRAANLVRQLLAFSRQQTLQPRIIDIGDVLSELSHLLNRLLGENVELKMVQGRNLGMVRVDQGQLEQVIINLAVNARDAMPGGGTLVIKTSNVEQAQPIQRELEIMPAGSYVLIEVTDNGTGIPREIMARIFEPFFSTKEVGSGTGLGLSTVYGIVKQTGGFIFVDSTVGVGTRFSIYLPRHQRKEGEAPPASTLDPLEVAAPRDLTGAGTILLVEDEDPVRLFSARALRNKGYTVVEAKSGEQALQIIQNGTEPIDLIVTDVVMPRMDGPTLIKQVRESRPHMKVVFISGYTEDTFRKRIGDDAGIHFLAKPFSLKQLAFKVKEIMGDLGEG